MNSKKTFNSIAQVALPVFTLGGQLATASKFPEWGLVLNLMAQPFWLYSTWRAYKEVGQSGMFINTVIFAGITIAGIINYWFL
jgi:hypothetical protein